MAQRRGRSGGRGRGGGRRSWSCRHRRRGSWGHGWHGSRRQLAAEENVHSAGLQSAIWIHSIRSAGDHVIDPVARHVTRRDVTREIPGCCAYQRNVGRRLSQIVHTLESGAAVKHVHNPRFSPIARVISVGLTRPGKQVSHSIAIEITHCDRLSQERLIFAPLRTENQQVSRHLAQIPELALL